MFEGLIEQLILAYLGDYIENLDKDKLSLGVKLIIIRLNIIIDMVRKLNP